MALLLADLTVAKPSIDLLMHPSKNRILVKRHDIVMFIFSRTTVVAVVPVRQIEDDSYSKSRGSGIFIEVSFRFFHVLLHASFCAGSSDVHPF